MQIDKYTLHEKLKIEHKPIIISLFDQPPQVANEIKENYNDYNGLFIKDVFRLLEDFPKIQLVYKPKRSLVNGKFYYSTNTKEILHKPNPRVKLLHYQTNPWLAIALADICITPTMGSAGFAGLHYGKPFLFHDPMNFAKNYRLNDLERFVSHSYPELKKNVKKYYYGLS